MRKKIGFIFNLFLVINLLYSCEDCKDKIAECPSFNEKYVNLLLEYENKSIEFTDSNNKVLKFTFDTLVHGGDQSVRYKHGGLGIGCMCDPCTSEISVNCGEGGITVYQNESSDKCKKDDSRLNFWMWIDLMILKRSLALPLEKSSTDGRVEYIELLNLSGESYNSVYRMYSSNYTDGKYVELPGCIYYSESDGIIGFTHPETNALFIKSN